MTNNNWSDAKKKQFIIDHLLQCVRACGKETKKCESIQAENELLFSLRSTTYHVHRKEIIFCVLQKSWFIKA